LVRYEIDVTRIREGKTVLGIADCAVFVDGQRIYVAEDIKVGLFTSLDDFA
jgi:3-hydroxyacyl-[acyl-carrier protein] dehydratase/trans-2-decenoyl-[acyl-carrier protein] isomerase